MKRKIAVLLLVLALLTALAVPAFASKDPVQETTEVTDLTKTCYLSEDLQQVQMGAETYVRFNDSRLSGGYYQDIESATLVLSESQRQSIEDAYLQEHTNGVVLKVSLKYFDGTSITIPYIRQDLCEAYQQLLTTNAVTVNFYYPDNNQVKITLDYESMEQEILFFDEVIQANQFMVVACGNDVLEVSRGTLLLLDDQFYYFDYDENGTADVYENERVSAWRITDADTCAALDAGLEAYYGSDLGFFEDEDFSRQVSNVFLIILFVVLPGIALVLFLILAIRAKTPVYRKLLWNLCAWSALVLILVGTVVLVVQLH